MQNIGKNQSEKARKEIEKEYKLIQAEGKQRIVYELKPVNAQKLQYGKTETKRAITNVLDRILPAYKYSSLPELNAILKAYNIVADRGSENSRIYKAGGLVYRVLDEKGQKVGTPIKASDFYNKPTLKFLEERFKQNEVEKQQFKQKLKHAIDLSFLMRRRQSIQELSLALSRQKIQLVLRQNEQGIIYGMTYIDHGTRCVFNGSDLGKEYSAKGIQERCNPDAISEQITLQPEAALKNVPASNQQVSKTLETSKSNDLIHQLTKTEYQEPLAIELKRKEYKKRKRKRLHL